MTIESAWMYHHQMCHPISILSLQLVVNDFMTELRVQTVFINEIISLSCIIIVLYSTSLALQEKKKSGIFQSWFTINVIKAVY